MLRRSVLHNNNNSTPHNISVIALCYSSNLFSVQRITVTQKYLKYENMKLHRWIDLTQEVCCAQE
jgi:hypothetical protein